LTLTIFDQKNFQLAGSKKFFNFLLTKLNNKGKYKTKPLIRALLDYVARYKFIYVRMYVMPSQ